MTTITRSTQDFFALDSGSDKQVSRYSKKPANRPTVAAPVANASEVPIAFSENATRQTIESKRPVRNALFAGALGALALAASYLGFMKLNEQVSARGEPITVAPKPAQLAYEPQTEPVLPVVDIIPSTVPSVEAPPERVQSLPVESSAQLEQHLPAIRALQSQYEAVASQTNVPWQLVAAIDYREANNDPTRSAFAGEKIGTTNPDHGDVRGYTKFDSLLQATEFLKNMSVAVYGVELGPNPTYEDVQMASVAYNRGYMYKRVGQSPASSPYAMNGFSESYLDMTWPNSTAEPPSTRGRGNVQLGTLTIMSGLGYDFQFATP